MKLLLAGLFKETNTFSPIPVGRKAFATKLIPRTPTSVPPVPFTMPLHIWRTSVEAKGWEVIDSLAAWAQPAGMVSRTIYEEFRGIILEDVAMAVYWDPVLVDMCRDAGVDARMRVRLGGKRSKASGNAIDLDVTVRAFRENMVQDFGLVPSPFCTGVWPDAGGVHLIVNNSRTQCLNPSLFTDLGLDLTQMKAVVVKSSNHYSTGFAPIAAEVIHMATPGTLTADFASIPYAKRDPTCWPRVENPFA